ncbi:MAG: BatD family protein [Bacteroidaceae bacterium]|nr:BatD family protein [Bacteroidaceae bacterium]
MNKIKVSILAVVMLVLSVPSFAQKLTIQAPAQAEVGRRVRVSYTLNSNDFDRIQIDGDFTGFDLLFGPSISTSNSIRIINGQTTQSSSTTFTYTLAPTKAGTFTLPSASLNSGGQKVKSGTAKIEILPASDNSAQSSRQGGGQGAYGQSSASAGQGSSRSSMHTPSTDEHIGNKDLYFIVTASKKHVFEQEAILLTYKLYSLVTVEQLAGEIPQLDGFHTQEIEQPQQRSFTMERVGNKNYGTVVWRQYVVFPQKSGKLTIPSVDYEADVVVQDRNIDPFDAFFGGGSLMQRVKKIVKAPAVEIQVDPLPAKPANFSGAVGKGFTISGKLVPEQIDANDATTLTLTVSGTGNMKLISCPTIEWPKDFEQYDPKTTDTSTKLTTNGTSGKVVYECVAVPHHGGKYEIPPVEFCYFDTDSRQYKTIKTQSFELGVAKGANTPASVAQQEEIKELTNDIHYIKQGDVEVRQHADDFYGSVMHWLSYLLLVVIFAVVMIIFRRQVAANADTKHLRRRKASKAAAKRLKSASKLLAAGKAEPFYDEVMRALWGYVADKLSLPVTDLTKDNVSEKLLARGVDGQTTENFLSVLGECEFARFAPGDPATNMENLYNRATEVIDQLEDMIQKA